MIAYKGMCPGMVCLGYQLKMGLNVTEEANCQEILESTASSIWFGRAAIWMRMR